MGCGVADGCRWAWGAGEESHGAGWEAVVDDVKSNGVDDGELKLRRAGLEFRGSKKEGSEGRVKWGIGVFIVKSRVARGAVAKRQPL